MGGWGECHVSQNSIINETSGTIIGVYMSYGMENSVKALISNDENVFKILTLGPVRK